MFWISSEATFVVLPIAVMVWPCNAVLQGLLEALAAVLQAQKVTPQLCAPANKLGFPSVGLTNEASTKVFQLA